MFILVSFLLAAGIFFFIKIIVEGLIKVIFLFAKFYFNKIVLPFIIFILIIITIIGVLYLFNFTYGNLIDDRFDFYLSLLNNTVLSVIELLMNGTHPEKEK